LPAHTMKEIVQFFQSYKALEKKKVEVESVQGRAKAQEVLLESLELYKQEFLNQ